jgi:hypothetical protein
MFSQKHITQIEKETNTQLIKIIQGRLKKLEDDYQENPFISKAEVSQEGEEVKIKIQLNFDLIDSENQDIPLVFEYGGALYKRNSSGKKEIVIIEPGLYINRNLIQSS